VSRRVGSVAERGQYQVGSRPEVATRELREVADCWSMRMRPWVVPMAVGCRMSGFSTKGYDE
jgi:hypothetical protein